MTSAYAPVAQPDAAFIDAPAESKPSLLDLQGARLWLASFAVWTGVAVLDMAGSRLYAAVTGSDAPDWSVLVTLSLTYAAPLAIFTPGVFLGSRRFLPSRAGWPACVAFHLVCGLIFALGGAAIAAAANALLPWTLHHVAAPARAMLMQMFLGNLPRYCVVVAVSHVAFYYSRYHEREVLATRLESQLAHAQLSSLKMQLEPHFIFNVLNAIATLARRDPPAAETMTLQLADLLRLSLENVDVHEVPLRKELQFLECYLRIQQTRFSDRLSVEYRIEEDVLDAAVPHLIMQPLVENAIRHGIAPKLAGGRIEVSATRRGGRLAVEIRDDGMGLPPGFDSRSDGGVGLSNTRARLRQLYGHDSFFECVNAPGGGCCVRLALPFRPAVCASEP